jgi:hypothetical protein
MQIFDPEQGIVSEPQSERDVSADLIAAEAIIRGLESPMFIEDLIKLVQQTCSLTNDEVYGIVQKINAEINN